jgi:RNA polymerase sigma-70 factor (ECF subfamily)
MWVLWAVVRRTLTADPAADRRALERMARGDHDGLAELYDRHARLIYSLALRIAREQADAEDVVQEVFSQAWRQAARYDPARGPVVAWLLTLTRSRALDRLRARRVRPWDAAGEDSTSIEVPDTRDGPDALAISAEQVARVRAALDALPVVQRVAIELAYFEGLTHTEIASRLEQPLGTVKTRIRQGLVRLGTEITGKPQ